MKRKNYTHEENMAVRDMIEAGKSDKEISLAIGRPISSVQGKRRWLGMTAEQHEQRRKKINARRVRGRPVGTGKRLEQHVVKIAIPGNVLIDRDRRINATLTINQAILGDPVPGRSALDKRMGRV